MVRMRYVCNVVDGEGKFNIRKQEEGCGHGAIELVENGEGAGAVIAFSVELFLYDEELRN